MNYVALIAAPAIAQPSVPTAPVFQTAFDDLGPAVQTLAGPHGRAVHYIDTGEAGWRPVLFLGGTGTSARLPDDRVSADAAPPTPPAFHQRRA